MRAAQRALGLQMLVGSARLARVFDGDATVTGKLGPALEVVLCAECFARAGVVALAWEAAPRPVEVGSSQ
jgi:hypothetical protein